jgi:hypothetical protein
MTEQENKVSGEGLDTSVPTLEFSDNPVSPTSTLTSEQIEAFSNALKPVIEEVVERKVRSSKDKRFQRLEDGNMVMTEVLATLRQQGATIPEAVEREYALKEHIDAAVAKGIASQQGDNGMSHVETKSNGQFDALELVKQYGLDPADEKVVALFKAKNYRSVDHFEKEVLKLAVSGAAKPTPSSSSSPVLLGGGGASQMSDGDKLVKFAKLGVLYKTPSKSAEEIKVLEKELGIA